ncbi:sugar phosphate isomerase [Arenivirga flava]|uniref:Sugar phosphate isomerase n=1 Tax=Arenivirga flava TaxID=1930060 RepID=A0AA37ULP6_9MICO|nr:sugar phosphate isomerase [Arenivirga flava]
MRSGLSAEGLGDHRTGDILALAERAGLQSIEWSGDAQSLSGDRRRAAELGSRTRDAGLVVGGYRTPYRVGIDEQDDALVDEALALGARRIRVRAGLIGAGEADEATWRFVIRALRGLAARASDVGIGVGIGMYPDSLADCVETASLLVERVGEPTVRLYWSPPRFEPAGTALRGLYASLPLVCAVEAPVAGREPLAERSALWERALRLVDGDDIDVLLQADCAIASDPLVRDAAYLIDRQRAVG